MKRKSKIKIKKSKLQKIKFFFRLSIINRQPRLNRGQSSTVQSGFTLIELMVVIAIIGLLTAVVLANFTGIQKRSRDGQRKTDLRSLQHALELYRTDVGSYPATLYPANCMTSGALTGGGNTYMQRIPCDYQGTTYWNGGNYLYSVLPVGCHGDGTTPVCTTYYLYACMESTSDPDVNINATGIPAPSGSGSCTSTKYYTLTNP